MPNLRYNAGRRFEYQVRDFLRSKGWWVLRSAGSKSPCDLVALRSGEMMLIQCKKSGNLSTVERDQLIELSREHQCLVVLVKRSEKGKLQFEEVKRG